MVTLLVAHRRLIAPWLLAGLTVIATLMPWLARLARGESPIDVEGTRLTLRTAATALEAVPTMIGLVVYLVSLAILATVLSLSQHDEQREVRRMLQLQTWQLRQLVPRAARSGCQRVKIAASRRAARSPARRHAPGRRPTTSTAALPTTTPSAKLPRARAARPAS